MGGEDRFRKARREGAAVVGRAGLHIDRSSLRRSRNVERAADAKVLSDVVDGMDPGGVGEDAGRGIIDQRIVFPAVPQPRDDVEIFARPLVTLVMRRMFGQPEILRCLRRARRDDVPAGAAAAEVIQRGEQRARL